MHYTSPWPLFVLTDNDSDHGKDRKRLWWQGGNSSLKTGNVAPGHRSQQRIFAGRHEPSLRWRTASWQPVSPRFSTSVVIEVITASTPWRRISARSGASFTIQVAHFGGGGTQGEVKETCGFFPGWEGYKTSVLLTTFFVGRAEDRAGPPRGRQVTQALRASRAPRFE